MTARLLAMLPTNAPPSTVKHYAGIPPELTDGNDARNDAKNQAAYEYEGVVLVWDDVPQSVLDIGEYGLIRNGA